MKKLGTTKNYNGNIYITKEIRKNLDIKDGEILEIFTENNSIILKKDTKTDEIAQNCARWVDQYKNRIISITNIEGKTSCVFHSNSGIKQASVIYCPSDKFDLNIAICYCAKKVGFQIEGI